MAPLAERERRLANARRLAVEQYPGRWAQMTSEWCTPGDDRAWLMYAANYLFRTGDVRWALDPFRLGKRMPEAAEMDAACDLAGLSFVLLTHAHADHLDLELVQGLREFPIRWVVPGEMRATFLESGISPRQVIVPGMLEPLDLDGVTVTPFDGSHWQADPTQPDGLRGVPETGYLAEFSGRRWLFPGDVRDYDGCQLPDFGEVDGAFAHLWLGRAAAGQESPPLLEAFCRFCARLRARRVIVAHLYEWGREPEDIWDESHLRLVQARYRELFPGSLLSSARMGDSVGL